MKFYWNNDFFVYSEESVQEKLYNGNIFTFKIYLGKKNKKNRNGAAIIQCYKHFKNFNHDKNNSKNILFSIYFLIMRLFAG